MNPMAAPMMAAPNMGPSIQMPNITQDEIQRLYQVCIVSFRFLFNSRNQYHHQQPMMLREADNNHRNGYL
jgi:hypothetical protein